jgi:hypothetical protein
VIKIAVGAMALFDSAFKKKKSLDQISDSVKQRGEPGLFACFNMHENVGSSGVHWALRLVQP